MWWGRILNRQSAGKSIRFLERVISPSESHSPTPFRIVKAAPPPPTVEPVAGADYRLKRDRPNNALKQCF